MTALTIVFCSAFTFVPEALARFDPFDPDQVSRFLCQQKVKPAEFDDLAISLSQIRANWAALRHERIEETFFVVPKNDGEALRAVEILMAVDAPRLRVSRQSWGATLAAEDLQSGIPEGTKTIAIFEIPGLEIEAELRAAGYEVVIFDHHFYQVVDRRNPLSSLEQLMEYVGWHPSIFDRAIAINDRSYIAGLKAKSNANSFITRIREYDLVAQGRSLAFVRAEVQNAKAIIPTLKKMGTTTVLPPGLAVDIDIGILKQELAILSPNGIANTLELARGKIGYSGSPEVVNKFMAIDFEKLGYAPGSFEKYGGGDPTAAMFFGFIPRVPPKINGKQTEELIPESVRTVFGDVLLGLK